MQNISSNVSVATPFLSLNAFLKLQQIKIKDILYERERSCLKIPDQIVDVVYLHIILFRMHERDTTK